MALWKIKQLLRLPFRFRTQCYLECVDVELSYDGLNVKQTTNDNQAEQKDDSNKKSSPNFPPIFNEADIKKLITDCNFGESPLTSVYYPITELFKSGKEDKQEADDAINDGSSDDSNDAMED